MNLAGGLAACDWRLTPRDRSNSRSLERAAARRSKQAERWRGWLDGLVHEP